MSLGKLLVFIDHIYRRHGERVFTDDNFVLFLQAFVPAFSRVLLLGRVHPKSGSAPYLCAPSAAFAFLELPYYPSLYAPSKFLRAMVGGVRIAWKAIGESNAVLLGVPHPWALALWLMSWLRRRPVIFIVRQDLISRAHLRASGHKRWMAVCAVRILEAVFIRLARHTLTFSVGEAVKQRYDSPGAPVHSILTSLLTPQHFVGARARTLPSPGSPRRLLWVGRVDPDKGLEVLLEAFSTLVRRSPDMLELDIVGAGRIYQQLQRHVEERGLKEHVHLHGYVPFGPELSERYEAATAFILPSNESEGFPKVIMEAMATGLPVVATSVAGIPYVLKDRVHALLVPAGDPAALADAAQQVLTDRELYSDLSAAGLELARQYTLESQSRKMLNLMEPYIRLQLG